MWWTLLACSHPLSNQIFYEDSLMVAALPSTDRVAPPEQVRLARVGDDPLLAAAVAAAADLGILAEVVGRSGDALRAAEPTERTDVSRSWDAVQTAGNLGDGTELWWVRGQVRQVEAGADLTWTLDAADDADGPWVEVAAGRHDPGGYGSYDWELQAFAEVLGLSADVARLSVSYDDPQGDDGERSLEVLGDTDRGWYVVGEIGLGHTGDLPLTEPPTYGSLQAVATEEGGWGLAELFDPEGVVRQEGCWDANGDTAYAAGYLQQQGAEGLCPFADPFEGG